MPPVLSRLPVLQPMPGAGGRKAFSGYVPTGKRAKLAPPEEPLADAINQANAVRVSAQT